MSTYRVEWDFTFQRGEVGEVLAESLLKGESVGSVEVKTDGRWQDTGNVYVEYECQHDSVWKRSGIATTTASHWAFVLEGTGTVVFVETEVLKAIARDELKRSGPKMQPHGSHPTKGVAVPLSSVFDAQRTNRKKAS